MKKIILMSTIVSSLLLASCGNDGTENENKTVVTPQKAENNNSSTTKPVNKNVDMKMKNDKNNIIKEVNLKKDTSYNVPSKKIVSMKTVSLTDFVEAKPNTKYKKNNGGYVFYFDKNKKRIKFEKKEEFPTVITTPSKTAYLRLSIPNDQVEHAALVEQTISKK